MNYCLLTIGIWLLASCSFGQIIFEKGYIVDNYGVRTECLIKNQDWKTTPDFFLYKKSEEATVEKGSTDDVKEFGINGGRKFQRLIVNIDASQNVATTRNPSPSIEIVFVMPLNEGPAKLYQYKKIFLFTMKDSTPVQLVYRKYKIFDPSAAVKGILENNLYKQQLLNEVQCEGSEISPENVDYSKKDLLQYFETVNNCLHPAQISQTSIKKTSRKYLNIRITAGIDRNKLTLQNAFATTPREKYTDFDPRSSLRAGIDIEYVLPFNKNKWRLFIEPNYLSYKNEKRTEDQAINKMTTVIDYKSIEIPVGLRFHLFLNNESTIFLTGGGTAVEFNQGSTLKPWSGDQSNAKLLIKSRPVVFAGLGLGFKRLSVDTRFYFGRTLTLDYQYWESSFSRASLIVGYHIF